MKTTIAFTMSLLAMAGCSKKEGGGESADTGGGAGGGESAKPSAGGTPAEFASWMPADAQKLWDGAWQGYISLQGTKKKKETTTMAGEKVAIEVKGDKATVSNGDEDIAMSFKIVSPCGVELEQAITDGNMKGGKYTYGMFFTVENGALRVSSGAAGIRKGKTAVVCSEGRDGGVTIVDDKGGCATWKVDFMEKKWASKPETCAWSQQEGKDVLQIGTGDWATKVVARGDVLESDQFTSNVKSHEKAADFATAKAAVAAHEKANDPAEQAKAAGGVAGKTDTVASLRVSFAADAGLKGKQVEVTGVLEQVGTMTSNGEKKQQLILVDVDSKDDKIDLMCTGTTEPYAGAKKGDKVVAKGTVAKSFGTAALDDCTVTAAK